MGSRVELFEQIRRDHDREGLSIHALARRYGVHRRTVREYVQRRRRELGGPVEEVFVPQVHEPGVAAEVDWGEAVVELAGQRRIVSLFLMRACYSGAAFVIAFERQTQQAFLDAHVERWHPGAGCAD